MLERALKLRDEEKYQQAQSCLLEASKTNPEAMFHLAIAYQHGGWGFEKDRIMVNRYITKSANAGFGPAQSFYQRDLFTHIHEFDYFLARSKDGDELAQYELTHHHRLSLQELSEIPILHKNARVCSYFGFRFFTEKSMQEARKLLWIAHRQKCFIHSSCLVNILLKDGAYLCASNVAIASNSHPDIVKIAKLKDKTYKVMYKIGKWSKRNPSSWTTCIQCIHLYDSIIQQTRSAIYTWSLCAKRLGVCKDITQLIGRFVWKLKSKDI